MGKRLSDKEIQNLIYIHKSLKNKRDADKVKCLVLWGKGWKWERIQEALLVSERYISDVTSKYKEKGIEEILKNNFKGHNNKMTKEQQTEFVKYLENSYIPNSKFACKYVKERFNINYTEEGMVITLKRLGFRYKKPVIIPGKIPDVETQKKFTGQAKDILNNLKEKEAAYFWDGAGMVHNVKLDYGWIKKGQSKIVKTNTGREKMNIYQKVFKS